MNITFTLRQIIAVWVCAALCFFSYGLRMKNAQADFIPGNNPSTTISIDASSNKHAIDPHIYGLAYADSTVLKDLNFTLNRRGGNNTSRYNWQQNVENKGSDYFYESIPFADPAPAAEEDSFMRDTKAAGADPIVTIPTIGWVAKAGPGRSKLSSFSIAKYGPQQSADYSYFSDAGNGLKPDSSFVTGNDPSDANILSTAFFQQGFVQHLVQARASTDTHPTYYTLDNEPSIWQSTHRDVHPTGAHLTEIRDKIVAYAAAIKVADPLAQIMGPEEWGWPGYFYSGFDQQTAASNGWSSLPDRQSVQGQDYYPWLLAQLKQHDTTTNQRSLDVLTAHFYPQGGEYSDDVSPAMQQLRSRSTRSLWDPAYVNESWISTQVSLIPRLKNWVNSSYPGLQTGITEYNWGAGSAMNGATTEADILGIFGREGLNIANYWAYPGSGTPVYNAMKLFRNYDGNHSTFGDQSIQTTVANPDSLSAFSSIRTTDGALTAIVDNKDLTNNAPVTVALAHFAGGANAQVWQLSNNTLQQVASIPVVNNSLSYQAPYQSVTLLVVPPAPAPAQAICLQLKMEGQLVANQIGPLTVTANLTGSPAVVARTTNLTSDQSGTISITDSQFIAAINNTSSYDLRMQIPGFLKRVITGVKSMRSQCVPLTSAEVLIPGDFNGDNLIGISDIIMIIRAFNRQDDTGAMLVKKTFGGIVTIGNLITVIRGFNTSPKGDS